MATLREDGKRDWNSGSCIDQIKVGAIQRIADACELMAGSYAQLIEDRNLYKRWWQEQRARADTLERSNRGLRGYLNRLKAE